MGLLDLEHVLTAENIGRVPVVEGGKVVAIVTRKDVLRAEHGDGYLDRGLPRVRGAATARFLSSVEGLLPPDVRGAIREAGALAGEQGMRAHVVGGFVRDMLLGRANLDVDVVVEGDGIAFAQEAARRMEGRVKMHRRFGTAVLVLSRTLHMDVTSARTEYYTRPGALPTVERSSLRQDLLRRDFSINAMAASIVPETFGQIADPFGGLRDLDRGVIRALHSLSFVEDPTRVLRAARFETRFGFKMDPSTLSLARHAVEMGLLDDISGARIRAELYDILAEEPATPALKRLQELGALEVVVPDGAVAKTVLKSVKDTEAALASMPAGCGARLRREVALMAALSAGCDPRDVERWVRRLRLGRETGRAPVEVAESGKSVLRALSDKRGMRDSRLHALLAPLAPETVAWLRSASGRTALERVDRYLCDLSHVKPAVSGRDLIEMGAQPSPAFSAILAAALADRLDGRAVGREPELANLRRRAERAGILS